MDTLTLKLVKFFLIGFFPSLIPYLYHSFLPRPPFFSSLYPCHIQKCFSIAFFLYFRVVLSLPKTLLICCLMVYLDFMFNVRSDSMGLELNGRDWHSWC